MNERDFLIGLGSNLGDREEFLTAGLVALLVKDARLVAVSDLYESRPVGDLEQPEFLNASAVIRAVATPREMLHRIAEAERDAGRLRAEVNGPRTLDLDILLVGEECVDEIDLTVPHPRMLDRAFVMVPARQVAPEWRHPISGRRLGDQESSGPKADWVRRIGIWRGGIRNLRA